MLILCSSESCKAGILLDLFRSIFLPRFRELWGKNCSSSSLSSPELIVSISLVFLWTFKAEGPFLRNTLELWKRSLIRLSIYSWSSAWSISSTPISWPTFSSILCLSFSFMASIYFKMGLFDLEVVISWPVRGFEGLILGEYLSPLM